MSVDSAVCSSFAPKPAWAKADRYIVVQSDDQAGRIEIRLRENELFEQAGRGRLHPASLWRLVAPDFGQARRIGIAKRAESIHGERPAGVRVA